MFWRRCAAASQHCSLLTMTFGPYRVEAADALGRLDEDRHLVAIVPAFDCRAVGRRPDRAPENVLAEGALGPVLLVHLPTIPAKELLVRRLSRA